MKDRRSVKAVRLMMVVAVAVVCLCPYTAAQDQVETASDLQLTVLGSVQAETDNRWRAEGRVLHDGEPVAVAAIWVIADYGSGNLLSPAGVTTDSTGAFVIPAIPGQLGTDDNLRLLEIEINARGEVSIEGQRQLLRGRQKLAAPGGVFFMFGISPRGWIFFSIVVFMISVACAVARWPAGQLSKKYYLSISLAIVFTVSTIFYVACVIYQIDRISIDGAAPEVGVVKIFPGSYVEGHTREWLVSFTEPNANEVLVDGTERGFEQGLGAPFWVILLAVIGAALFTLILVIDAVVEGPLLTGDYRRLHKKLHPPAPKESKPPADASSGDRGHALSLPRTPAAEYTVQQKRKMNKKLEETREKLRGRIQRVLRHQFFILFAPIGAIFVYQLLIQADAAANSLTVAIAALAAGVTPYWLLDKALSGVKNVLEGTTKETITVGTEDEEKEESPRAQALLSDEAEELTGAEPAAEEELIIREEE